MTELATRPSAPLPETGGIAPDLNAQPLYPRFRPYTGITYYDIPPLKPHDYRWRTATAFFCSGIAGGAQILSQLEDLKNGGRDPALVRAGRYTAAAAGLMGTGLLISELHTRSRWYNMLRLVKRTSPMSIGIWAITPFVAASTAAALGQWAADHGHAETGRRIGRAFGLPAALLGTVVMSYMGTEQEETNVPLWAGAYPLLAPFYAATGLANAAAALRIAAARPKARPQNSKGLDAASLLAGGAQALLAALIGARWGRRPETSAFAQSSYAGLYYGGLLPAGIAAPLLSDLRDWLRGAETATGGRSPLIFPALRLAGGLLLQMIMIYAGKDSSETAEDYFHYTQPVESPNRRRRALPQPAKSDSPADSGGRLPVTEKSAPRERSLYAATLAATAVGVGAVLLAGWLGARQTEKGPTS